MKYNKADIIIPTEVVSPIGPLTRSKPPGKVVTMRRAQKQELLAIFDEPAKAETATGRKDSYRQAETWAEQPSRPKGLGQVPTPKPIAEVMAIWVTSNRPKSILDPAVGFGNLIHECWLCSPSAHFSGIERDENTLREAVHSAPPGTELICGDYLKQRIPPVEGIIANPPYVKAHRLDYSEADWRLFEDRLGTRLDRLTNLYALFLLKIWDDLANGGRAAVIIPAEFLNANFGVRIKERLLTDIRPAGIAIFDTEVNLFDSALTASCIVFLEKRKSARTTLHAVKVHSAEEVRSFVQLLLSDGSFKNHPAHIDFASRRADEKWLNLLFNGRSKVFGSAFKKRVGEFFRCSRGIATGANDYFCLSKSVIERHGLKSRDFDFCVTKATNVNGLIFTKTKLDEMVSADRRCFLLNPNTVDSAMAAYLKIGESEGIPKKFLPSHRKVWYLPENRNVAEVLVAVFSRQLVKYILNTSGARNLTCFHGLYAKEGNHNLAPLMTLFLNSSWGQESFSFVNRFYGDGLNKLEPKDVEAMPCPEMPSITEKEAAKITKELGSLETLHDQKRQGAIDRLAAKILELEDL